jgi:hypothetical protein
LFPVAEVADERIAFDCVSPCPLRSGATEMISAIRD